jgi:hypothetical protein
MPVIIGIDPHKATHTAVAIDGDEQPIARLQVVADRVQTPRLLAWAEPLGCERTWAIESATGLGKLLAQQLLAAGEQVLDVPPTLSARVRLLGSAKASKNDDNDALSTAIAGLRHCGLRTVGVEDHTAVLRLLIDRYDDLVGLRTRPPAGCMSCCGSSWRAAGHGECRLIGPPSCWDRSERAVPWPSSANDSASTCWSTSGASIASLVLYGVGPIVAALILGHVGDPARFATPERAEDAAPAQPTREPQAEPRHASHRRDPDPQPHTGTLLLRPQARREQVEAGSIARLEAAHQ